MSKKIKCDHCDNVATTRLAEVETDDDVYEWREYEIDYSGDEVEYEEVKSWGGDGTGAFDGATLCNACYFKDRGYDLNDALPDEKYEACRATEPAANHGDTAETAREPACPAVDTSPQSR